MAGWVCWNPFRNPHASAEPRKLGFHPNPLMSKPAVVKDRRDQVHCQQGMNGNLGSSDAGRIAAFCAESCLNWNRKILRKTWRKRLRRFGMQDSKPKEICVVFQICEEAVS